MRNIIIFCFLLLVYNSIFGFSHQKHHNKTNDNAVLGGKGNLAHWSFESNLLDSSVNHNDGSAQGLIYYDNRSYCCLRSGANGGYVRVNDSTTLDMPEHFTWVGWDTLGSSNLSPILWKASLPNDINYRNMPSYGLWLDKGKFHAGILTQKMEWIEAIQDSLLKPTLQNLFCVTYNGKTLKLYINCILVASARGKTGGPIYNSKEDLEICRMTFDGTDYNYQGTIDELGIYNYTFTPKQVLSLYNSPNGILPVKKSKTR